MGYKCTSIQIKPQYVFILLILLFLFKLGNWNHTQVFQLPKLSQEKFRQLDNLGMIPIA